MYNYAASQMLKCTVVRCTVVLCTFLQLYSVKLYHKRALRSRSSQSGPQAPGSGAGSDLSSDWTGLFLLAQLSPVLDYVIHA